MTVARIAPSIVISKMMIRFGHQANVGRPPTLIGHDVSVTHARPNAAAIPISPPPQAIHQIQLSLSMWPNSKSSIGCAVRMVIWRSVNPDARSRFTACWADWPSEYRPYTAFISAGPRADALRLPAERAWAASDQQP